MQGIITITIPALLLVGNSRFIMAEYFLRLEYTRPGFPFDRYGFSTEDRLDLGTKGLQYLFNDAEITFLGDLTLRGNVCYPPDNRDCPAFETRELKHMQDVKEVTRQVFRAGLWGTVFTILIGISLGKQFNSSILRRSLIQGSLFTLGLITTTVLLAITSWDLFFRVFHGMFFEEGTWQFYYSDTLIRLYPQQLWFDAALVIGGLTGISAVLILLGALKWKSYPLDLSIRV